MAELGNSIEPIGAGPDITSWGLLRLARDDAMTDQETMLQAFSNAQCILEEFLLPSIHDNERLLTRLVEELDRAEVVAAVSRLRRATVCSSENSAIGF